MQEKQKHPGGRPREHNREQIAKDLIEWARKEDSINLNAFCALYDPPIPPSKIYIFGSEDPEFRKSVEIAKAFLAARRESWLSKDWLHVKGYDINAATYDYFLKEEKRDQAKFESSLRKEEVKLVDEKTEKNFDKLMGMISDKQTQALNNAESNINIDCKS